MDDFLKLGEYGVLGIALLAAGLVIRHLWTQLNERTKEFATQIEKRAVRFEEKVDEITSKHAEVHRELVEKVDAINDKNLEHNKAVTNQFVGLYEQTVADFKELHTLSIDALKRDGE